MLYSPRHAKAATSITNCTELQAIKDSLAGDYVQTQNIDCSGIANFEPIGTAATSFTGTYDGGPWYFLALEPIHENLTLTLFNWNSEQGKDRLYEVALTKRFPAQGFEFALVGDSWKGDRDRASLMLDWSNRRFGIGAIIPANSRDSWKLGTRAYLGNFELYLAMYEPDSPPLYGVSLKRWGTRYEFAWGRDCLHFRASRRYGHFTPELRTRQVEGETFIGFGLGYSPE